MHRVLEKVSATIDKTEERYGVICTVLYCTVVYCAVLYCTVMYCTVLCETCRYNSAQAVAHITGYEDIDTDDEDDLRKAVGKKVDI